MVLTLIMNFCILFTFAFLSYWPFQRHVHFQNPFPKAQPYIVGVLGGLTGLLLIRMSLQIHDNLVFDARHVLVLITGLVGGPIAMIVSGLIIGLSRMFLFDYNFLTFLAGINIICVAVVMSIANRFYPITFKNSWFYFLYATGQMIIGILFALYRLETSYHYVMYFILFSIFAFFVLYVVLRELTDHFDKLQMIEALTVRDYQTTVYNNRGFEQLMGKAVQEEDAFSILSLDLDGFKQWNDEHGRTNGDLLLKQLACELQKTVHKIGGDIGRKGGQQFVVLLHGAPPAIGITEAEKLRQLVEGFLFAHPGLENIAPLTCTIGVSSYPDNGATIRTLLFTADEAMYAAKREGKNRVKHYTNLFRK